MEGFKPVQLIALRVFLLLLPLVFGGCFDYEEHLRVLPTGEIDARIHTLLPPWLRALPTASAAFYPTTATGLAQKVGGGVKPSFVVKGGVVDGFKGRVSSIDRLDTTLIRHSLVFSKGGAYTFRVTLLLPREFAGTISDAVARHAAELPRIPRVNRGRVREAALDEFGYRLEANLPGQVTATNGLAAGSVVSWKVPLRQLVAGKPVELTATGQLSLPQRFGRKLGFSSSF